MSLLTKSSIPGVACISIFLENLDNVPKVLGVIEIWSNVLSDWDSAAVSLDKKPVEATPDLLGIATSPIKPDNVCTPKPTITVLFLSASMKSSASKSVATILPPVVAPEVT